MPYIDYLLRKTMLLTADANLKPVKTFKVSPVSPLPSADRKKLDDDDAILDRALWQYECNGLTEVKNVAARDRTTDGDPLRTVFDYIRWGEGEGSKAHVKAFRTIKANQEQKLKLPLTKPYLLRTYFLNKGKIASTTEPAETLMQDATIWQLPTNLCSSFQYVFGYELLENGEVSPISNPDAEDRGDWVEKTNSFTVGGQAYRVVIPPKPRILVCLGLGCATERKDFEPGGVLGAARIYPHFMFMTTTPLNRIEAEITCARPSQSSTSGTDHAHSSHGHSSHGDGSESMNPGIEMAFYTDANTPTYIVPKLPLLPKVSSPYWDDLFDYYWVAPPDKQAMTVVASKLAESRNYNVQEAVMDTKVLTPPHVDAVRTAVRLGLKYSRSKSVSKLPRQGEFDNVHLAPTMRAAKKILDANPWPELQRIAMAPFCAHDCLHMHWRWGQNKDYPRYSFGWGGTAEKPGGPFQVSGAPLVPANQDIHLKTLSATAFVYEAVIHKPQPTVWQPVMHHGAAYSISSKAILRLLMAADDGSNDDLRGQGFLDQLKGHWSILYWNLRYRTLIATKTDTVYGAKDAFLERLNLTSSKLEELREVKLIRETISGSPPKQKASSKNAVSRRSAPSRP